MASDINSVTLVGRLTADPELRSLPSGESLAELRIAVNSSQKVDGQYKDVGNFFGVTIFGKQAEAVARYTKKGSRVGVQGRLSHRTWTTDSGDKRERVSVVAQTIQFLETKAEGSAAPAASTEAPF